MRRLALLSTFPAIGLALIANPGKPDGDWLGWFSRVCEGTFGQWGSGSLIFLVGSLFFFTGLAFISIAIFPSKTLQH